MDERFNGDSTMKHFLILVFSTLFFFLLGTCEALAQWTDSERSELAIRNILQDANPGFENGLSVWVASGGSTAKVTSGTNLLDDKASATWNASASGDWFRTKLVTIPKGLYGRNGLARIKTQVPSGTATTLIQVYDGTNVITSASMSSTTTPTFQDVNFIFPSSGSIAIRAYAQADEPLTVFDSAFIGDAINFLSTSTVGEWTTYTPTGNFTTNTTYQGRWRRVGDSMEVDVTLTFDGAPNSSGFTACLPSGYTINTSKLSDGTGTRATLGLAVAGDSGVGNHLGNLFYSSANCVGAAGDDGGTSWSNTFPITFGTSDFISIRFIVPITGWSADLVQKLDAINWRVDANISGANPSLGTSDVTSYTEITNSGLTMTPASGSAPVGIVCSSTNPATSPSLSSTTCAAGDEGIGANFNIPWAGSYKVCAQYGHFMNPNGGGNQILTTFQIVETASNAQTIIQEGKNRTTSALVTPTEATQSVAPYNSCGTFYFSSSGNKTLRLMYEQDITGTISNNLILADGDANTGQRDVKITIEPLNGQAQAAPIVNSVTSSYSGASRIEWVSVPTNCGSSPCTIGSQSGGISSITRVSAGYYEINFTAGVFSSTPACIVTAGSNVNTHVVSIYDTGGSTNSATLVDFLIKNSADINTDNSFYAMCMGPR